MKKTVATTIMGYIAFRGFRLYRVPGFMLGSGFRVWGITSRKLTWKPKKAHIKTKVPLKGGGLYGFPC